MLKSKNNSVLKNIIFTHKYILEGFRFRYYISAIAIVLSNIATTFMLVLLPAYVVKLLNCNYSIPSVLVRITVYCLIMYTITILYKSLESITNTKVDMTRMIKGIDYYDNIMTTNYINIDNSAGKKVIDAGIDSYVDRFHIGYHHFINDTRVLIQSIAGLIVYCVFIAKTDVLVSFILIAISSFSIIVNMLDEKWINNNKQSWFNIDTKIKYLSTQSVSLKNAKDVRLYSIKNWFMSTIDNLIGLRQNWLKKELRIYYLVNISERSLTALKYAIAYFVIFQKLRLGMDISQFILTVGLILGINNWITSIFNNIKYLQINNISVNNTKAAFDINKNQATEKCKNTIYNKIPDNKTHEIRFENVSFSFPESDIKIFDNFNLTIHKGEKLALVGINGAGKTTLVKLMCGLYQPTQGKIYLDSIDIASIKKEDYFKLFSIVFQDFQILAMSLAENISCCIKEKTDFDKVNKCIELAGLSERVEELKYGVNTTMLKELDDEGVVLSGGQSQKLMLARCLYKDSPIIILDEPTSALDALAESEMYEKYSSLTDGKTSIFISHRLSSTRFCDRIIMLKHGAIIEEGTHDELLDRDGEYARMYNIQSYYYQEGVDKIV